MMLTLCTGSQRGSKCELIRQCEGDEVNADCIEVDGGAGEGSVVLVQLVEVTIPEHGVSDAPAGEVHHRITDVCKFEVEHRSDTTVLMMKLT